MTPIGLLLPSLSMSSNLTATTLPETTELDIKSILVVDDDLELAEMLKELLESRNYVVTVVGNGAAALHEVMAMDFDVIVCDLLMPRMPGDMFYLAVKKARPALADRFLFVTGHSENPKVEAFLKQIDAQVLFKPVLTEDLVRMISLVLKTSAERRTE
ncbi:MAG: response regulator [Verrucomicrobiaceae bacterium]|nr:MAG: response regulator [Verrucomicrobiaceae bacterium]